MTISRLILLVEDEVLIQDLLEQILTDAGYEPVIAQSGVDAIIELERGADRFGGVITDIRLGVGPNGWAVGHRARELAPHVQVVYISGDSGCDWASQGVPNSVMIDKPFAVAQIVTAISVLIVAEETRRSIGPPVG